MATAQLVDERARQALHYVKVADRDVHLTYFPDFLIVGPQRTGTTWLHANLRYHPQIMLSEPKELFFFSSLKTPESKRFRSNELAWYLRYFREPVWRIALRHLISLWRYRQLYRPTARGEATASYAVLDRDVIADITTLKPDIKVILTIRDPIERAWSHAKKDLVRNRGRKFEDVSVSEFEQFFKQPYQRRCAQVVECIDNWSAALQPGHLLVGLFDDIDAQPEALLLRVMSFLGVTSDRRYVSGQARQTINPTGTSQIPEGYRRFLEDLLRDDLANLRERFGLSWPRATGGKLERERVGAMQDRRLFALHERG